MRLPLFLALIVVLLLAGLAAPALAEEPRWGRLYTVTGNVPVRENPADSALQVRVLKAGQKVRVDFQDEGWAAVFDPKEPVRSELRALGYAKLAELKSKGNLELAQATSIEVKKPRPDARPEVRVDGRTEKTEVKPEPKPAAKTDARQAKAKAAPARDFGEIRVADRQLTVRAGRDKDSEFRRVLKAGQRVRVDFLEDGWFAVFDPEEKVRDLSRAWGFSRDKYLVLEAAYSGPLLEIPPAKPAPVAPAVAPAPAKGQKPKAEAQDDDAVGYAVLERKDDHQKPTPNVTMRVRLELTQAPAPDALRKIVREIWKAERKKNENLQLEVLLTGMDAHGLAYAVARFHDDGRLREFWWRDVVVGKGKK